jgi:hypothetical protein
MKAPRQEVQLMAFAGIETRAPNPEAWLVHPFLWLQPELTLSPVPSAALRPERCHELPAPQFAPLLTTIPASRAEVLWVRPPGLRAMSTSRPPASDLEPLRSLL